LGKPVLSYSVDNPVPLSEIHQGEPDERAIPQGLTRLGSTFGAVGETLALSVVRSVLW
jgi:hypothetical protein